MSRIRSAMRKITACSVSAVTALSPALWLAAVAIAAAAGLSDDYYLLEILVLVIIYAQFSASWDVLSGLTEQDNFGHALFIGGAGYVAAMANKWLHISPWLGIPLAASVAALAGMAIGWLTLRLRGPYFALTTIAFSAVLFKVVYMFSNVTGGEEGISGIAPFTSSVKTDLAICLVLFLCSTICLVAFARSHYGLILRSTQHNEEAAQASGIDTAHYKVAGFAVSSFFAGVGGAMYAHTHMQVNPELLAGSLSVLVVLLATAGGRGTIIGPIFAAGSLMLINEGLRVVEEYRVVLFTGGLILLVYLFPSGIAKARVLTRFPAARRFLFGRES